MPPLGWVIRWSALNSRSADASGCLLNRRAWSRAASVNRSGSLAGAVGGADDEVIGLMVRARECIEVGAAAGGDGDRDEASAGMAGQHDSRGRTTRQTVGLAAGRLGTQPHRLRLASSGFVDDIHVGEHAQGDGGALRAGMAVDVDDPDGELRVEGAEVLCELSDGEHRLVSLHGSAGQAGRPGRRGFLEGEVLVRFFDGNRRSVGFGGSVTVST